MCLCGKHAVCHIHRVSPCPLLTMQGPISKSALRARGEEQQTEATEGADAEPVLSGGKSRKKKRKRAAKDTPGSAEVRAENSQGDNAVMDGPADACLLLPHGLNRIGTRLQGWVRNCTYMWRCLYCLHTYVAAAAAGSPAGLGPGEDAHPYSCGFPHMLTCRGASSASYLVRGQVPQGRSSRRRRLPRCARGRSGRRRAETTTRQRQPEKLKCLSAPLPPPLGTSSSR